MKNTPLPLLLWIADRPQPAHLLICKCAVLSVLARSTGIIVPVRFFSTVDPDLLISIAAAFLSMVLGALQALEYLPRASLLPHFAWTGRRPFVRWVLVNAVHPENLFLLGAASLYAARSIVPNLFSTWISALCGLAVCAMGGILLLRNLTGESTRHLHAQEPVSFFSSRTLGLVGEQRTAIAMQPQASSVASCRFRSPGHAAVLALLLSALALGHLYDGALLCALYGFALALTVVTYRVWRNTAPARKVTERFKQPVMRRLLLIAPPTLILILGIAISIRAFATAGLTLHSLSHQKLGPALLVAGLGLGIRHATDADHVVAISTIVSRQRSIRSAAMIGTLWGVGHTLTIFFVGCLIILGGVTIPPRIGLSMEFCVALMLILLGVLNLTGVMQKLVSRLTPDRFSLRAHASERPFSASAHSDRDKRPFADPVRRYGAYQLVRPLAVGLVHGLAGSAAVALLVLSTIHNPLWAAAYLVVFGGGTLLGMMAMTAAMALPLVYAGDRLPRLSRFLGVASGLVSVCFGMFLVYQLGYLGGLFTSHPRWTPQ